MRRDKSISFSDLFNDDPFIADKDAPQLEETIVAPKKRIQLPTVGDVPLADDADLKHYQKSLRQFFVSGEKTSESLKLDVAPILFSSYLRGDSPETGFPVLLDHTDHGVKSLRNLLDEAFGRIFKEGDAALLKKNLTRIESYATRTTGGETNSEDFATVMVGALRELEQLDIHGDEGPVFKEHLALLRSELLKFQGVLIGFSPFVAFQVLNLQLKARQARKLSFLKGLKKLVSGLDEIVRLHTAGRTDDGGTRLQENFDFAGSMISFDRIVDMSAPSSSTEIPETRLKRVQHCLDVLKQAQKSFAETHARVFVTAGIAEEFSLKQILTDAALEITVSNACAKAKEAFDNELNAFVQTIAAIRIAELEVQNKFDEHLHTHFFNLFGIQHLATEELQHLSPIIVVEESDRLMNQPEDLLLLLTATIPVKVLAVNRLADTMKDGLTDRKDNVLRNEPVTLALLHRNAFVFQGAADTPLQLNSAISDGLDAPSPALWNLLFTANNGTSEFIRLNAAIESRCFPRLTYNVNAGERFGSRFDISANPQPELHFPVYPMSIRTADGEQTRKFALTVADCFALDTDNISGLEIIPAKYRNDGLVPLAEYLALPHADLIGKVPFIWTIDEKNILQQVAIPFTWLNRCMERSDNWQFIQELGGVNSYHVKRAIELARGEWEQQKEAETAALKADMDSQIEAIRREEAGKAMERLVDVLLDLDNHTDIAPAKSPATKVIVSSDNPSAEEKTLAVAPPVQEEQAE
ncbi:MAG: hypothetical protein K9J06_11230, partial [Flavobacteriales bacterium]|nr:hypothetical protein [Flavobacteriales bacterium]